MLIELVKARRCLWDKGHKDYKDNRTTKQNNWEDIYKDLKHATHMEWKIQQDILGTANISSLAAIANSVESPCVYFDYYQIINKY